MHEAKQLEQPFASYPSRVDHEAAWEELARRITAEPGPGAAGDSKGELTILGSGIETAGFTTFDERLIQSADKVFFCVADPATVVWIKALRPDAYDLYVLYDEGKTRYITYMQMTEAMLYYVRRGKKVVAVYYGHPGVFVLSTHRAVRIARREGHRAVLRAGISALDTLCADLGVDPSQPGMQTFEATDMLIRGRVPDTGLHVVLWQVGVIGELGYRRGGFLNSGLSVLIEYLQKYYGKDYPVTNYIGSRYPGVAPTTDVYPLSQLHEPEIQSRVTGISTFYLAAKDAAPADLSMMVRLRLASPGAVFKKQVAPLRVIDSYGEKETAAFEQFKTFKVPRGYHWQEDTAAARFVLALRLDSELRGAYIHDPASAVSDSGFRGLSDRERAMLASRDAGAVQLAAKGVTGAKRVNTALLNEILCSKSLAKSLHRAVVNGGSGVIEQWALEHRHQADASSMLDDWEALLRSRLFPWSGAYVSADPQWFMFIMGHKRDYRQDRVFINGVALRNVQFQRGRLQWTVRGGNPHNGHVHVDVSPAGARRLVGSIWPDGEEVPGRHRFAAREISPGRFQLCQFIGEYETGGSQYRVAVQRNREVGARVEILCDGVPMESVARVERSGLRISDNLVPFRSLIRDGAIPDSLRTEYVIRGASRRASTCFSLTDGALRINGCAVAGQSYGSGKLKWTGGPDSFDSGEAVLLIDPISLLPMCYGEAGEKKKAFTGMKPATAWDQSRKNAAVFGMPKWAWEHLVDIAHAASSQGGLFLWNAWERHSLTHRLLYAILSKRKS